LYLQTFLLGIFNVTHPEDP